MAGTNISSLKETNLRSKSPRPRALHFDPPFKLQISIVQYLDGYRIELIGG